MLCGGDIAIIVDTLSSWVGQTLLTPFFFEIGLFYIIPTRQPQNPSYIIILIKRNQLHHKQRFSHIIYEEKRKVTAQFKRTRINYCWQLVPTLKHGANLL